MKSTYFYAETNAANGKGVACSVSTPSKVFGGMSFILFLFISLLSFTATAQNFTPITLPHTGECDLESDGNSRPAYFKVTLSTSSHLHFKINEFIGSSSSNNTVSYALSKNPELTQEVLSGRLHEAGDDVVTESLAAGTYYLKWHSNSFSTTPFSWTMTTIEPSKIKEFRTINYDNQFTLSKNIGKLSQSEATMVYIGSDYTNEDDGDVSVDHSGGMDIFLAKGFTFKAEGGKVYKITMQGVRENPTGSISLVGVFFTGGGWSTPSQDMRGSFGGEFNRGKTTLHAIEYFRPTKTEDLRVLVNSDDISNEVSYAIQIEEAIVQNTSINFENITTFPFEEDVTFKADNSTSYRGERIRGYKFTLDTDATVYFYGHNTVYGHQPSMVIRSREFSAEEINRSSSSGPQYLPAGTHYVAFTDRGFYRDEYFTTRLKISLNQGEPSAPSPTVGNYTLTPLTTLLNNAEEVTAESLPHTAIGSFVKGTSALVPEQPNLDFTSNSNNSGSFFSLAKKITVAAGGNLLVSLKYRGKEKPASDNSGSDIEPSMNVFPRLFVYSKDTEGNYQLAGYIERESISLWGGAGTTYWIVATCSQAFDEGNYRLNIRSSETPEPHKPAINSVTVSPTTIDIPPTTSLFEKEILVTRLTVKGTTADGETFTLPNTGAHWTIGGNTATYTTKNAETNDYTISTELTGTVTFNIPTPYTVTFHANGGSGSMAQQSIYPGQSLSANTFTNSGQTFNYWTTESNGSGTKYTNGQVVTLTGNLTLYAQWTAPVTLPTLTFGEVTNITGSSATLHATITPGTVAPTEYGFTLCCGDGDGRIPVTPQGNQLTHNATGLSENNGYEVNAYYVYNGTTYRSDNFTFFRTLRATTEITNLSHDNVTHNSATFSVNIFEGTEEPVIDRKFQYRNVEESEWTDVPGGTGTSTFTVTATGLTPGTFYVYRAVVTVTGNVEKRSREEWFETLRGTTEIDNIDMSNITRTAAKLTAKIYEGPEEPITGRKFQYKNVEESEWTDVPGGTGTSTFTATATGLTPGTGYTARAVVTVTGGGEKISVRSFTTLAADVVPAIATTLAATEVTKTSATLNGTINDGTQMVSFRAFEYRKEGETDWNHEVTSGTTGNVTRHLTGLNASTTYEFRLLLLAGGEHVEGEILTFTTLADVVTTLAATAVTQNSAKLNGTINAENVTERKFEYKKRNESSWSTITATGTTAVSANITGLTASTTYEFRLMIKTNGLTKRGNILTFITPAAGVTPATATTTTPSNITKNSATLNGTINEGTQMVTDPKFEYRIKNGTWSAITAAGTTAVSANVTGLVSSSDYQYRLVITADGRRVEGNIVDFRIPSENYVKQTVETGAVTEVTKNSATLNGKVTAGSEPITARGFEYKAVSATAWTKVTRSSDGSITAMIIDLTADTEYEVRAYATTDIEAITGNVVTFTTAKEESTGITKENLLLTLYPNPATTVLNINNIEQTKATSIEVFDISGRLLLQTPAAAVIDISTLPQGVYTVKAGNYTAKMMKR